MKLRPLQDRVMVRRVAPEAKTSGGIFIPDTAQEQVLFGKWSGAEVKLNGEDLMIMKESDIMGVVDLAAAMNRAA